MKCNKNISEATKAFQGSTHNVEVPTFLRFATFDEDDDLGFGDPEDMDGDIEFADPDLEMFVEDDDDEGIAFELSDDDDDDSEPDIAFDDDEAASDIGDQPESDLDQAEDTTAEVMADAEGTTEFAETSDPTMDFPDELADISDLSPPEEAEIAEALEESVTDTAAQEQADTDTEPLAAEPEDDLDFSNMDFDLNINEIDQSAQAAEETISAAAEEATKKTSALMDEDLDFELDLGGLSIHDDK
ncbi:MAG: hypothetical protein HKP41_17920 [Desulfobacterales bacterium]|nr:hypothetical protein [Deltaproteobacteria bacterium]NNK96233.1 hypothetical protein [Desulfobacterales bacterium]